MKWSGKLKEASVSQAGIRHITDDIVQVRLPLPYKLNSVNCYLLRGADGWTMVDTGLNTAAARAQWHKAMTSLGLQPSDIRQIVLTHLHPDHFGMAGWWQRQTDAPIPLYLPAGERGLLQTLYQRRDSEAYHQWLLRCGMTDGSARELEAALSSTRDLTQPHPLEWQFLEAGTELRLGERDFQAIHAPGHSDGQLIFYDTRDRLMLCGDHVLMRITPNVGNWAHSQSDPLGRFLHSLRELKALDVRLALPGHKRLITDWRGRIDEILAHHETRLAETEAALEAGARTCLDAAARLFDMERLTPHEWRFALAETLAHLEHLRTLGLAQSGPEQTGLPSEWLPASKS